MRSLLLLALVLGALGQRSSGGCPSTQDCSTCTSSVATDGTQCGFCSTDGFTYCFPGTASGPKPTTDLLNAKCQFPSFWIFDRTKCGLQVQCPTYSSCSACTSNPMCGWCYSNENGTSSFCVDGGSAGPFSGATRPTCEPLDLAWFYDSCSNAVSCYGQPDCNACVNAHPWCGWCNYTKSCGDGVPWATNSRGFDCPAGISCFCPQTEWHLCSCTDPSDSACYSSKPPPVVSPPSNAQPPPSSAVAPSVYDWILHANTNRPAAFQAVLELTLDYYELSDYSIVYVADPANPDGSHWAFYVYFTNGPPDETVKAEVVASQETNCAENSGCFGSSTDVQTNDERTTQGGPVTEGSSGATLHLFTSPL